MKKITLLVLVCFILTGCAHHGGAVKTTDLALYNQTVVFNNTKYIPLLRFCDYYDLDWSWDIIARKIELKKKGNSLILKPGSNLALVNKKLVELEHPVEYKGGAAYISTKAAIFVSEDVFGLKKRIVPAVGRYGIKTIVVDPGHGGEGRGAKGRGRYGAKEKHIVLDISKRLKKYLEREGINVLLTRDKDTFVSLEKRASFANKAQADFFISVHANASKHSQARGFEVFYLSEATNDGARALAAAENASLKLEENNFSENGNFSTKTTVWDMTLSENRRESKELAHHISNATSEKMGLKNRGVKGARFVVLKGAQMPAVLVEVGFLTNKHEESRLKSASFREGIARAIAESILAYKKEYEESYGFSR